MSGQPKARPILTQAWIVEGPDGPRIAKAAAAESQQLAEDPFKYTGAGESGLVRPLYDLDHLVGALEGNALHARCVRQKASDVLGRGVGIRPTDEESQARQGEADDRWGEFVTLAEDKGDGSMKERLTWAHEDYEGVGWATLEVSRGADGTPDGLWYVPGHTVRAHVDGRRFAQKRGGKTVWFKRYGVEGTVDRRDGGWSDRTTRDAFAGNELIVVPNHTPRSSYYGLPDHIPAMAALAGWQAQAQFNLKFFDNLAVPSYAVVIEGAELSGDLEEKIVDHFRRIKGDPARTLIIPVPGATGDEASQVKVRFEKLTVDVKDATHRLYKQDNALEICIAHGMPPYRVGWPIVGSLGGATAVEMTEIYLTSMVQPRQETWEQRLTRAFLGPRGIDLAGFEVKAAELDTRDELRDLEKAEKRYALGLVTPNDLIAFFGGERRTDPAGNAYIGVPLFPNAGAATIGPLTEPVAKAWSDEVRTIAALRARVEALVPEAMAA